MCYAGGVLTVTNSGVVIMHHNKDIQNEIIVIGAVVLAFWVFVIGAGYLLA